MVPVPFPVPVPVPVRVYLYLYLCAASTFNLQSVPTDVGTRAVGTAIMDLLRTPYSTLLC